MKIAVTFYVQNGYLLFNSLHNFSVTVRVQRKEFELSLASCVQEIKH